MILFLWFLFFPSVVSSQYHAEHMPVGEISTYEQHPIQLKKERIHCASATVLTKKEWAKCTAASSALKSIKLQKRHTQVFYVQHPLKMEKTTVDCLTDKKETKIQYDNCTAANAASSWIKSKNGDVTRKAG